MIQSSRQIPKITVAIATYQREEVLINTIKEVLAQDFDGFELLVVDQTKKHKKSTQQFLDSIRDERCKYYRVSPPSLPAARNFAIKKSCSDLILFIDDDVELSENFIEAHYHAHISRPEITAVAGRVQTKGQQPAQELFFFNWYGEERHSFHYPNPQRSSSFLGCNFSLKKENVKDIGLFDTNYCDSAMREESDMAERIKKAGYKIWYEPKAHLVHLIAPSGGCRIYEMKKDNQSFYKNDLYYTLKTVRFFLLPIVLAAKINRYVISRSIKKTGSRGYLFFSGLGFAIKRRFQPSKIISRVLADKDQV